MAWSGHLVRLVRSLGGNVSMKKVVKSSIRKKKRRQQGTVHDIAAVVVVDPERFEFQPKPPEESTLTGFEERSKGYRGPGLKLRRRVKMDFRHKSLEIFGEE
jgi:hypothetical protein